MAAGDQWTCGIRVSDGEVECWGTDPADGDVTGDGRDDRSGVFTAPPTKMRIFSTTGTYTMTLGARRILSLGAALYTSPRRSTGMRAVSPSAVMRKTMIYSP